MCTSPIGPDQYKSRSVLYQIGRCETAEVPDAVAGRYRVTRFLLINADTKMNGVVASRPGPETPYNYCHILEA